MLVLDALSTYCTYCTTELLSGFKYANYSLVVPALDLLYRHRDSVQCLVSELPEVVAASELMRKKMDEYRARLKTPSAMLATALDARYNLNYFTDGTDARGFRVDLEVELRKYQCVADESLPSGNSLISMLFDRTTKKMS